MHGGNVFEIDALRLLVTVAETGSFTKAAVRLDYTQSAVSRRIASLEKETGGPLFERLARGVRLNPAGRALHRHAVEVLARLAGAQDELAAIRAGRGGRLRVGAFATANVSLVPAALRAFARSRPEAEIVAVEGRTGESMRRLAEGALDLAVVSDYPSGLPPVDGVTTEVLLEDELFVVLPRDHRLAGAGTIDLRELRDETWLQDVSADRPMMLAEVCGRAGLPAEADHQDRRVDRQVRLRGGRTGGRAGPLAGRLGGPRRTRRMPTGDLAPHRTVHVALPATAPLPAALELRDLLRDAVPGGIVG